MPAQVVLREVSLMVHSYLPKMLPTLRPRISGVGVLGGSLVITCLVVAGLSGCVTHVTYDLSDIRGPVLLNPDVLTLDGPIRDWRTVGTYTGRGQVAYAASVTMKEGAPPGLANEYSTPNRFYDDAVRKAESAIDGGTDRRSIAGLEYAVKELGAIHEVIAEGTVYEAVRAEEGP